MASLDNCMISPVTKCSKTLDSNSTTSVFLNDANATEARANKKSPAKTANCETKVKK